MGRPRCAGGGIGFSMATRGFLCIAFFALSVATDPNNSVIRFSRSLMETRIPERSRLEIDQSRSSRSTMPTVQPSEELMCGHMFMTVSSLLSGSPGQLVAPRYAEVTWDYAGCSFSPRWLAIYKTDPPEILDASNADWLESINEATGWIRTNISVSRTLPGGWNGDSPVPGEHCWPFRVGMYLVNGTLIETTCLKIHPTWMEDHKESIGHLPLSGMFLPGTHNSGCYSRSGEVDSHMLRYLLTQESTIWEQLVFGVRYLDLRIGFYPQDMGEQQNSNHTDHGQRLWVNHDMVRIQPLQPLLRQVRRFLEHATQEIIILDFHRFPVGFRTDEEEGLSPPKDPHQELLDMLKLEFGDYLIPFKTNPPTDEIWREKGRVLVSYGDKKSVMKEKWLWPPISQQWGNVQTVDGLVAYIHRSMDGWASRIGTLWAAMAELTPTMTDVLFNIRGTSLRHMAEQVNRNITLHSRRRWKRRANIIASDFIMGTDLVTAAIEANLIRAWERLDWEIHE